MKIKNTEVIPIALGEKNGIIKMTHWRNTSGAYSISNDGELFAQMIQGSLWFKDMDKMNFIKIDVEGSELPIIEDMAELILKHEPIILIETGTINKVLEYLPGYKVMDRCMNDYLIGMK
jgi:FkbM family methyltransferase